VIQYIEPDEIGVYDDFSVEIQSQPPRILLGETFQTLSVECRLPVDIGNFTDYCPLRVPLSCSRVKELRSAARNARGFGHLIIGVQE